MTAAKRATEGQQDKMSILYSYLSGPDFRHRVQGIVEAFMTLRQDLEREKTAIQKLWAKREKHSTLPPRAPPAFMATSAASSAPAFRKSRRSNSHS